MAEHTTIVILLKLVLCLRTQFVPAGARLPRRVRDPVRPYQRPSFSIAESPWDWFSER